MAAAPSVVPSSTSPPLSSSPPRKFSRKISAPISSFSTPPSGASGLGMGGVRSGNTQGWREGPVVGPVVGVHGREQNVNEHRDTTNKGGKFHLPSLGGMLGKEKKGKKDSKKGEKKKNKNKKDVAGTEDLWS